MVVHKEATTRKTASRVEKSDLTGVQHGRDAWMWRWDGKRELILADNCEGVVPCELGTSR